MASHRRCCVSTRPNTILLRNISRELKSVAFTGVEIHSFAKLCLLVYGPRLSVPQSDLCRQIVSK